jgi:hypothetical protein
MTALACRPIKWQRHPASVRWQAGPGAVLRLMTPILPENAASMTFFCQILGMRPYDQVKAMFNHPLQSKRLSNPKIMRNQLLLLSDQIGRQTRSWRPAAKAHSFILKTSPSNHQRINWAALYGKLTRVLVFVVGWVLISLAARGQTLVETYFPLNSGDQKLFSVSGLPLTMTVSTNGGGDFDLVASFAGSSQTLEFYDDNTNCYLVGDNDVSQVSFDTPVLFLNDELLSKGGTAKTTTTLDGGLAEVTITVTVGNAGKVKVPAGTFPNCKQVVLTVKKDSASAGVELLTSSSSTTVIAPGVGIIKTTVIANDSAQLVNGTIGGGFLGDADLAPITIDIAGGTGEVTLKGPSGLVAPAGAGRLLEPGTSYTATAKATEGAVFSSWSAANGNTLSTSPEYEFTMESGLALQANFIPNPYLDVSGKYIGLFMPYGGDTVQDCGYASFTITSKGAFSGSLQAGAKKYSLSGQLDADLNYTNNGEGALSIGLSAESGAGLLTGTVAGTGWTASLSANQLFSGKAIYSGAGAYPVSLADENGDSYGTGVLNFKASGPTTFSGKLSDGTRFSASSTYSPQDEYSDWPFYESLYGGKGAFLGWMDLGPDQDGGDYTWEVQGTFTWIQSDGTVVTMFASGYSDY